MLFKFNLNYFFSIFLFLVVSSNTCVFLDAAEPWQLDFQDPATPIMEGIISFHDDLMFFVVTIGVFVAWVLWKTLKLYTVDKEADLESSSNKLNFIKQYSEGVYHNTFLEIVWTTVPAIILAIIAVPSFALLYSLEEFVEPNLSVQVTGYQWYWSYEYSNCKVSKLEEFLDGKVFESYMVPTADLEEGQLRLLEVNKRLSLPIQTHIQIYVTSADVLHCWAVPSLAIKMDACPGRLNQVSTFIRREGVFYGQCSEICGINHGFMPIVVEGVSMKQFVYENYIDALLNIVEDDPDLELLEKNESINFLNKKTGVFRKLNLNLVENENFLFELIKEKN